jgi:aspartyl-tRNA(Asn)/glutamyl-tRNA(Gln) amidotransferase subunit A
MSTSTSKLTEKTAAELIQIQAKGEANAETITKAFLEAIKAKDPKVKSFLLVNEEAALATARSIDSRRSKGEKLGTLAGVPIAVKDNICTKGITTTCGSKMLEHFVPPYDAHVTEKLHQADAVILGKTNLDEFAMGSSTENSAYQTTRNPWNLDCIPGGSSGGSAAAVAACEAPISLGSDTGGSIRQPASLCGIVGLKPTYGRVSRYGLVAYASSLDQIGTFSHDVTDTALLLNVIAGKDDRDSTCTSNEVPDYTANLEAPLKPFTIGVAREYFAGGLDAEVEKSVREALDVLKSRGATIKEISLPHSTYAIATYYLVATAEASSNLARYDGVHYGHRSKDHSNLIDMYCKSRGEGFGSEVKRRILLGNYSLSSGYIDAFYLKALKVRRLIRDDFDKAFADCDVIAGPTAPTCAFKVGEKSSDPLSMYLSDIYTISCNLAGIPGISIPCGFNSKNLPIGLQLLGAPFSEEKLLRIARTYEKETPWHLKRAQIS